MADLLKIKKGTGFIDDMMALQSSSCGRVTPIFAFVNAYSSRPWSHMSLDQLEQKEATQDPKTKEKVQEALLVEGSKFLKDNFARIPKSDERYSEMDKSARRDARKSSAMRQAIEKRSNKPEPGTRKKVITREG
jgi:hypothetical protein